MRNLWWTCWYLWEGLPTLLAFPINSTEPLGVGESWSSYWELRWPRYAIGVLGFATVALTLAGCLCCRRQRRPKGFQDDAGNGKEFKDGSTAGTETTIERVPSSSLELEVARIASSHSASSRVQFEALPVERLVGEARGSGKPKPPSPSLFAEEQETERSNFLREQPCREWFDAGSCHLPRERLKYLREIGRGWFGKVVEGTAEIPSSPSKKSRGVVVRILTEEATAREKAWFLGEATPYLKLDHPNVLTLLGSCLEADPYLLLFESCPAGDLKGFLRGNRDKGTCEALRKENVPTRMALDIANALEHMHENGFAHTDLSARNCLVAPDLSAKLGDYGTGVEKYPGDYYVVGDRALPIRWSAPESLACTDTTIETRAITPRANLWSYAVLLWEMASWGERPYDDLGDEQVIEMIFSLKSGFLARETSDALLKRLREEFAAPRSFREAIEASWKFLPEERATLKEAKEILCGKRIEDFEKRWENLRPNGASAPRERDNRSASLQDLRGSVDSELWQSSANEEKQPPQAQFRLGPDEPVKNLPSAQTCCQQESGSETEEESWRGRVERGVYTEKVKQKSKSVADLMVLVHIDSDSDAEVSLGPQTSDKTQKKRLPASGSDGDLRSHVLADEFDEAIRKLREPSLCNGDGVKIAKNPCESSQVVESIEKPKLLTLTHQGQTPILRLCFGAPESPEANVGEAPSSGNRGATIEPRYNENLAPLGDEKLSKSVIIENFTSADSEKGNLACRTSIQDKVSSEKARVEGPVLRLVSKGDPVLPLLRYVPETSFATENNPKSEENSRFDSFLVFEAPDSGVACFSSNFAAPSSGPESVDAGVDSVNVELWNNALAYELEKKNPGFEAHASIFDESLDCENAREFTRKSVSAPNTPKAVDFSGGSDLERKIDERNSGVINYYENLSANSFSAPNTPKSVNFFAEKSAGDDFTPVTPRRSDFERKIDVRSSGDFNYYENVSAASSSAPNTPKSVNFSPGKSVDDDSASSTSTRPQKNDCERKIDEKNSENVNYYQNMSVGSASAPESPGKCYFSPEIEKSSKDASFYQDLPLGTSSAPETPRKHFFEPETEEKRSRDAKYYRGAIGSASAPETPRFRGNYSAGQLDEDSSACEELEASERMLRGSGPDTPQSRGDYSVGNGDEDSSTGEELDAGERMIKRSAHEVDDEEDRKHLSTPDDERSSDSGFRDKESCEEEESPVPCPPTSGVPISGAVTASGLLADSSPLSASAEEEQMRILFELDTILDAEYYGSFRDSEGLEDSDIMSPGSLRARNIDGDAVAGKNRSISESLESTESTDVVETVRANSCEPDFLDSRNSREIASLASPDEEMKKLSDFLKIEAQDEKHSALDTGDETEADFLADSISESMRTEKIFSTNLRKDSSDSSAKYETRSNDSSAEIQRLSTESSGKFDKNSESSDFSIELRSSDTSELSGSRTTDNDSKSPRKSDRLTVCEPPTDLRRNSSEISRDISASTNQSPIKDERRTENSETYQSSMELENSSSDSPVKSERRHETSDVCEISADFVNSIDSPSESTKARDNSETCEALSETKISASDSPLKSEKPRGSSEPFEASTEHENSSSDSPLKSEKPRCNSETCEALSETKISASDSPLKSEKPRGSSETCEPSTELENSSSDSPLKSEKPRGSSEPFEASTEHENSSSDSPLKSEKPRCNSETCEALSETKISASDSPLKSEKPRGSSETCEPSTELENSSSDSPLKSEKPRGSSEPFEASTEHENSSSDSPLKSEKPRCNSETCEALSETKISASDSSLKSEKPRGSSETCEPSTEFENSSSDSPLKSEKLLGNSEPCEASTELENVSNNSPLNNEKPRRSSETCDASETEPENSSSDSPLKTDRNQMSELSMETRGPESVHSDADQWSSRENINENDNEDEDSSTMSLRSDNSYVSFGLDEEFVAAIRNELREKLPRAQMPVIEALDPRDEKEPSINKDAETKRWEEEEEAEESGAERGGGGVDISIRYNIYGTPLSPILEERESAGTSESLVSKEDSRDDASIASRVSALSEDVLVVDTRTNRAMMLEGSGEPSNCQQDEDRDTSHGDFSDEENLEYPQNNLNRGMENKRICVGSGGAPLPSPEEESKWQQQFPLPLQMQDDLMSTSFGTDRDWDSQDEDEGEDEAEEGEEDEEENSSSSGEFVWKRYDESHGDLENVATRSPPNKPKSHEPEAEMEEEEEEEGDEEDEEEEEEFTPSAWDATLAPHRSALRSPEKTLKSGDQKKSVWFKKQRYHCVYEYPKETPVAEGQGQAATTWEPTSYADWEEMMDEPRLDVYPMEYDETNRPGDEEFYVSSSNRPFQFQSGEGKYVSQFFPGASSTLLQQQQPQQQQPVAASEDSQESPDEVDRGEAPASPRQLQSNGNLRVPDFLDNQQQQQQQTQLGELRHTRDRLKLNLQLTSGSTKADEDVVENSIADIEKTELPQNKTRKTVESPAKTADIEKESDEMIKVEDSTSEVRTKVKTERSMEREASRAAEDTRSSNFENLAVKESPEVKIHDEQAKKQPPKECEEMGAKNNEEEAARMPRAGDPAVIRSEASPKDSPTIGDEKNTARSREILAVGQIVDIPKLETEESPESPPEKNNRAAVEFSMKIEGPSVQDAVAVSPAKSFPPGTPKIDEKPANNVHSES